MMEKIKNIYGAHPIPWTLGLLALVIAAAALIFYYPAFSLEAAGVPVHACEPAVKGAEIPLGGVVTVAQSGGRTLKIDTETMILTLTDDATGITWSSAMEGASADNLAANALLQITFRGEDNVETIWNTYQNCVAFKDYKLYQSDNGVRIEMDINEGNSKVYLEYLPSRFPRERYETFIIPAVDQLLADGKIDEKQHQRYRINQSLFFYQIYLSLNIAVYTAYPQCIWFALCSSYNSFKFFISVLRIINLGMKLTVH
jgi:hypothetical protein